MIQSNPELKSFSITGAMSLAAMRTYRCVTLRRSLRSRVGSSSSVVRDIGKIRVRSVLKIHRVVVLSVTSEHLIRFLEKGAT